MRNYAQNQSTAVKTEPQLTRLASLHLKQRKIYLTATLIAKLGSF